MGEREVSSARHNYGARKRFFFFVSVGQCVTMGSMGCSGRLVVVVRSRVLIFEKG